MEDMERYLMEDEEVIQEIWPENISINDDISLNLDFIQEGEFASEILSFFGEDEFSMQQELPMCFTNNEEQHHDLFLPDQYLQLEQEEEPQQHQPQEQEQEDEKDVAEEEEEEEDVENNNKKPSEVNSKNLVSERNRRKRLNRQLFALRSIVPNITKMDKRSILVDALAYLRNILRQIEMEMEKRDLPLESSSCKDSASFFVEDEALPIMQTQQHERCAALPAISEMEAEMLDEERFIIKIGCNKAMGALGQVHRVIEMLGLEITCLSINEHSQEIMQTVAFLRTKKKGVQVTQEKLLHHIRVNAAQMGLLPPDS